jgi:CPA2 family monovalent cation:H+ antiporter-2
VNHTEFIYDTLVFLLAAVVVVPLFHRLRTSPILGYLVAGMLIGPHGLGFIGSGSGAATLAELGVVFLLFTIGLELSLQRLLAMGRYVFGLGIAQVLLTGAGIAAVAVLAGYSFKAAAVIGGALALSSTAFVLHLLEERGERGGHYGFLAFAILLLQDLAVVPLLIMVTSFAREGSAFMPALGLAFVEAAIAILVVVGIGQRLLRPAIHAIAGTRSAELFTAVTLLAVLGTSWLLARAGLSMALGAFLAGLLLAETPYRHQVESDIRPFRGLLLGLFFMTIGMNIDAAFVARHIVLLALIVAALLAGKALLVTLLCRLFGAASDAALRTGLALAQGGEFGFVLLGTAGALELLPGETVNLLLAAIALSMAATPGLVALGSRLSGLIAARRGGPDGGRLGELPDISGHVLIAGFGRVGQTVAKVLGEGGIAYVAIDYNRDLVVACRSRGLPVYFGNASQPGVLHSAGLERAAGIVITFDQIGLVNRTVAVLRGSYPDLRIFVRARDLRHLRRLETDGATATVLETAEASLQLGAIVMKALGVDGELSGEVIDTYREDNYARLEDIIGRSPQ